MEFEVTRTFKIKLTTDELALVFTNLNDEEQARFFNLVGNHFREFNNGLGAGIMQAFWIADHENFDDGARWFIEKLYQSIEDKPYREEKNDGRHEQIDSDSSPD